MRRAILLALLLPAAALAQSVFGFPPVSSTQFKVAGVLQTPQPNYVDFGSGLSGSLSGGTLTITVAGGAPASTYLPLAGGTMTGDITLANSASALKSGNYTWGATSGKTNGAAVEGFKFSCTNALTTSNAACLNVYSGGARSWWQQSDGSTYSEEMTPFAQHALWNNNATGGAFAGLDMLNSAVRFFSNGFTPIFTISSSVGLQVGTTATYPIGDSTHILTQVWSARVAGGNNNTAGHVVPNVADATFVVTAAGTVEHNMSAYNAGNLAATTAFAQFFVTNASTITAGGTVETQDVVGVGAGNFVTKLCSDGTTCGAGNIYVTCTEACTAAVGTTTACTVNKSAVAASTTLTESVTTACATTDPGVNFNVHLTTP